MKNIIIVMKLMIKSPPVIRLEFFISFMIQFNDIRCVGVQPCKG